MLPPGSTGGTVMWENPAVDESCVWYPACAAQGRVLEMCQCAWYWWGQGVTSLGRPYWAEALCQEQAFLNIKRV